MYGGVGLLLIAAVGGYWVLERSVSHRGRLRQIGQLVGGLIIIVSLVGVGCRVWYLTKGYAGHHGFGKMGKGWYHHAPSSAPSPSTSE